LPAAVQSVADTQATPESLPYFGLGVGTMDHLVPFQDSATGWYTTFGSR
jgi:hypothetical protein